MVARAALWVSDGVPFGAVVNPIGGRSVGRWATVEDVSRSGVANASQGGPFLPGAPDGSFEIPGLSNRPYTVCALDLDTLAVGAAVGRAVDEDLVVIIDGAVQTRAILGRVTFPDGRPAPGVRVFPGRRVVSAERSGSRELALSPRPVMADADGRFGFDALCPDDLEFAVVGDEVFTGGYCVPDPDEAREGFIELRVRRRCRVRLVPGDVGALAEGTTLSICDATGKAISFAISNGLTDVAALRTRIPEVPTWIQVGEDARSIRISGPTGSLVTTRAIHVDPHAPIEVAVP